uniref:Alpha/beta hydrolase n=1 Tax=Candidatus Kentrum sp. DK TaxID=2126562 RepID=A0A450T3L0_9GAMM|nr:MAG: hypothetical protein BECKDK2373B_GA0170837_10982 [Candidatus Kentron sp. DK]
MAKHIFLVHGRDCKPGEETLRNNWEGALRFGISRENPAMEEKFESVQKTMVYYGDRSNEFLRKRGTSYDEAKDQKDRGSCLDDLKKYRSEDFNKEKYNALPGKSAFREAIGDIFSGPLTWLGLEEKLVKKVAPDIGRYWSEDTDFGSEVRWRLAKPLATALREGDDIMLICHSLGTLIAYDVLWKFSHYSEYRDADYFDLRGKKITALVTLGSPLGDETVKRKLKGAGAEWGRRYPSNIGRWINMVAEDDYIAHDESLADDYEAMEQFGLVESVVDHKIYNLAVREGKSNPHHGAGYLIHPVVSNTVIDWLVS